MRTPSWESSPGALVAFLNSATQRACVDLVTLTLVSGQVIRYSGSDRPVTINGNTYVLGPLITRGRTSVKVGIEVDSLEITLACDSSIAVNGASLLSFSRLGGFDGARVELQRAYAANAASDWIGSVLLFAGKVGPVAPSRYEVKLTVKSDLQLLDVMVPRNVYQPGCLNDLFEPSTCGLLRAAWTFVGQATGASDATRTIVPNNLSNAAGFFDMGVATFTSGANAGVKRTVRSYSPTSMVVIAPWPFAVAAGDAFKVEAGCDKTKPTCELKFDNRVRFRGQPYIPVPETVT